MKKEEPPIRPKHLQQDHAPTVIHNPEEDETVLARWLRKGIEQGPIFWLAAGGLLLLAVGLWLAATLYGRVEPADAKAWKSLILATDTTQRAEVGREGNGAVASWALIQAAEARYLEGFQDMPQSREDALEKMKAAYDLFLQARDKAGNGSHASYYASLGMARTLEARGDLDGAIKMYEELAKGWAETPLGEDAGKLAERLKKPSNRQYYEEFAAFKPTPATLPPGGSSPLDLGFPLPGGPSGTSGNVIPGLGDLPALIPPSSAPATSGADPGAPESDAAVPTGGEGAAPAVLPPALEPDAPAPAPETANP